MTADYLTQLIGSKSDMKAAIEEKGVAISGGLSTYADAIRQIEVEEYDDNYIIVENYIKFQPIEDIDNITLDLKNCDSVIELFRDSSCRIGQCKLINCQNVKSLSNALNHNDNLELASIYDANNVENLGALFSCCYKLKRIEFLNLGDKITNIAEMCYMDRNEISELEYVPAIKAGNIKFARNAFFQCSKLKDFGGLIQFGKVEDMNYYDSTSALFLGCDNLSRESMLNIVNGLYDRASAGYKALRLSIPYIYHKLSDEEIAIATNKGWIIETS